MTNLSIHENTIFLSGELKVQDIKQAWTKFKQLQPMLKQAVIFVDLSDISSIDSSGVAFLDEVEFYLTQTKTETKIINPQPIVLQAINSFSNKTTDPVHAKKRKNIFEKIGEVGLNVNNKFINILYLTADIFYWSTVGLFQKQGQRKGSFVQQSLIIGVNALQIVVLISFLIGLILALQSAAQLRQFGANIFVADLIGIAMLREMGPIMTAIVISGRSGSAIASEIATMVVTEEIDALKTMALNPIRYVIVPKFHAITITMPLLTILADLAGILGGLVIGVTYLQLSASAFLNELLTVVILKDVLTGLFKSVIFAWIIQIIACYQGLNVKGGAEGVGRATTASVVASIFFVIVADSIMGLIFYFE